MASFTYTRAINAIHDWHAYDRYIPSGSNLPVFIYVSGGGFNKQHPRALYDASVGAPIFTDPTYGLEATDDVACFSLRYGAAVQNNTDLTDVLHWCGAKLWDEDKSYEVGDEVRYKATATSRWRVYSCILDHTSEAVVSVPDDGSGWATYWSVDHDETATGAALIDEVTQGDYAKMDSTTRYRCRNTHNPTTATEPGVGGSWESYWQAVDESEMGSLAENTVPSANCFGRQGELDVARMVSDIIERGNAGEWPINTSNINIMGESAGGVTVASVVYGRVFPYESVGPDAGHFESTVARPVFRGCVLSITPYDWGNYQYMGAGQGGLHTRHKLGLNDATEYARLGATRRSALSGGGILEASGVPVATYLQYTSDALGDETEQPPYTTTTPYHDAIEGEQYRQALVAKNPDVDVVFRHQGINGYDSAADVSTLRAWLDGRWGI